ncbi:hypothetical protein [Microbacterium enclense]|uniref:hypothetical protein n=1 Tax=Microbacterium enclense TaxID=993073 RepID=UPI003F803F89
MFAPLGWAFFGRWHLAHSRRVLKLARDGTSTHEIDEALTRVWNDEQPALLRNIATPLGRFGRSVDMEFQRRCQRRQLLINEAIDCHFDGRYAASIALTLTQVDGLTRELMGTPFFKTEVAATEADYTDDTTLAGVEGNLPAVRRAFSHPVYEVGSHGLVSRHGVIHGRDISFNTEVNSTKTLVLLGALAEQLESRADERAGRWRSERDREKSALRGTDERGRLLDDRGLEELHMFRIEFESWAFNRIVFGNGLEADAALACAHEELGRRRLSRKHFSIAVLEQKRMMWTFRSPGGQLMASALSIPLPGARPVVTDQWTWDALHPPDTPPWECSTGWTPVTDVPTTPNWAFRGFYDI